MVPKIKAVLLTLLSSPISLGVFQIESYGPSVVRLLHVKSKRYIVLTKEGTIDTSVSRISNATPNIHDSFYNITTNASFFKDSSEDI